MNSINLEKGQKIILEKPDGSSLSRVFMGLGWDAAKSGGLFGLGGSSGSIDLDASCVMFDEGNHIVDIVSFTKLHSSDGSVRHSGDNLTGAGDGDDEVINVDLSTVPNHVQSIVFTINSFRGQTFDKVDNCFARLVETTSNKEICTFKLKEKGSHTAMVMAKVYRHNGAWKMAALGLPANGRTVRDIVESVKTII